ncbi:hypothetical protein F4859DRAFT_518633 [Xylaria cf. heliscus]|nr:hypothetical protein F4859DRAFT_518633 [Xylaria cf. heliscus]
MVALGPHLLIPNTITVEAGTKTKFFFLSITGLQPGTCFLDVWRHLKKTVQRIEHVEVFPEHKDGWVCVNKYGNLLKAIDAFRTPLYVRSTRTSTIITAAETNVDDAITIRRPLMRSPYAIDIMKQAIKPHKTSEPPTDNNEIVIAHGTHDPTPAIQSYNVLYGSGMCTIPSDDGWAPSVSSAESARSAPYPYYYYSQTSLFLPPPTTHTVSLSGFHHNTTMRDIQMVVGKMISSWALNDPNVQFMDGSTIVTSDKADARRLRKALDGFWLNGVQIRARRGQRPYEFATSPYRYSPAGFPSWAQPLGPDYTHHFGQYHWQYWR